MMIERGRAMLTYIHHNAGWLILCGVLLAGIIRLDAEIDSLRFEIAHIRLVQSANSTNLMKLMEIEP